MDRHCELSSMDKTWESSLLKNRGGSASCMEILISRVRYVGSREAWERTICGVAPPASTKVISCEARSSSNWRLTTKV
jgi:hypothetical protein